MNKLGQEQVFADLKPRTENTLDGPEERDQQARLENWYYDSDRPLLWGECYGHPRLPDGSHVHTAKIEYINEEETLAISLNTQWELGAKL